MPVLDASKARQELPRTLDRVFRERERIVIKRRGKPVAALVPVEDLKFIQDLEDRIDIEDARAALADVRKHGSIPWHKVVSDLKRKRPRRRPAA